ncbi:hypothetical protein PMIN06_008213 [Paraphaeosphaeria minitans]
MRMVLTINIEQRETSKPLAVSEETNFIKRCLRTQSNQWQGAEQRKLGERYDGMKRQGANVHLSSTGERGEELISKEMRILKIACGPIQLHYSPRGVVLGPVPKLFVSNGRLLSPLSPMAVFSPIDTVEGSMFRSGLVNGTNTYDEGGFRYNVFFTSDTSYRMRLVNATVDTHF